MTYPTFREWSEKYGTRDSNKHYARCIGRLTRQRMFDLIPEPSHTSGSSREVVCHACDSLKSMAAVGQSPPFQLLERLPSPFERFARVSTTSASTSASTPLCPLPLSWSRSPLLSSRKPSHSGLTPWLRSRSRMRHRALPLEHWAENIADEGDPLRSRLARASKAFVC